MDAKKGYVARGAERTNRRSKFNLGKKSVIITRAICLRNNNNFKKERTNVNCHWNDV